MSAANGADRQKWKVDENSRIVNKMGSTTAGEGPQLCLDILGARDENGAGVIAYEANGGPNQQWHLEVMDEAADSSGIRLVRIFSNMVGRRALSVENGDQIRKDMILEICYLARWSGEAGLVQLEKVVWGYGIPQAIILERLGKQLGKGTGDEHKACILQDVRAGMVKYTPRSAARSLVPVAAVLRRMHQDGFVYNDLHDGNILRRLDADSYKLIDLGSVTRTDHWLSELGSEYDSRWSINRDWRAFAVALLGLVLGGRQLDVWALVGTNSCIKVGDACACRWSSPVPDGNAGLLPDELEAMLAEYSSSWAPPELDRVHAALKALFAPRTDDNEILELLEHLGRAP